MPAAAVELTAGIPTHVGRYRVRSLLGEGGFGTVYLVFDEQLERDVAVKVPHRRLVPGPEAAASYLAEARAAARLDHPNIVPVYDVGSCPQFPCFIVSKLIEGQTLAQQTKEQWPSFAEAARLVTTVAMALHHAHQRGIVHRDIKPGNILIDTSTWPALCGPTVRPGPARGGDFGTGPCSQRNAGLHMSPEQARGEGHRVDVRSDVFSLGVVFYELLTKRRPFRARTIEKILEPGGGGRAPRPAAAARRFHFARARAHLLEGPRRARSHRGGTLRPATWLMTCEHFLASYARRPGARHGSKALHGQLPGSAVNGQSPASARTSVSPLAGAAAVTVIPRGLRSFEPADADFFLSLLPGPRDRAGLPESIRFWKSGVDQTDAPGDCFRWGWCTGRPAAASRHLIKAGLAQLLAGRSRADSLRGGHGRPDGGRGCMAAAGEAACPDLPTGRGAAGGGWRACGGVRPCRRAVKS